jgi:hypothetical protein
MGGSAGDADGDEGSVAVGLFSLDCWSPDVAAGCSRPEPGAEGEVGDSTLSARLKSERLAAAACAVGGGWITLELIEADSALDAGATSGMASGELPSWLEPEPSVFTRDVDRESFLNLFFNLWPTAPRTSRTPEGGLRSGGSDLEDMSTEMGSRVEGDIDPEDHDIGRKVMGMRYTRVTGFQCHRIL